MDTRYKSIESEDFSLSVVIVGYYVATVSQCYYIFDIWYLPFYFFFVWMSKLLSIENCMYIAFGDIFQSVSASPYSPYLRKFGTKGYELFSDDVKSSFGNWHKNYKATHRLTYNYAALFTG